MKVALLLPGYLDSPDYLHMITFEKGLKELGYVVERLDPCNLWSGGDVNKYTITNYIEQVKERVDFYKQENSEEIILIGHSLGGFVSIVAGCRIPGVDKIISLCSPPDRINTLLKWNGNEFRHSERDLPNDKKSFRVFEVPYSFAEDGIQYSAVEEVKKCNKPIMIFVALDDKSVAPEEAEKIVSAANSPHVVRQPNMGHDFRNNQEECNIVMGEIEKFLEK